MSTLADPDVWVIADSNVNAHQRPGEGIVSNTSQKRGTAWETAIVNYLISRGWVHAERRRLGGRHDRGDIAGIPGVVIEAKSVKEQRLAEFLDEANLEADNDGDSLGVVWMKRRGSVSPGDAYVVMDGERFAQLLSAAGY